ncbi:hypothetical protein J4410_00530 [Candidatus Woesearchaeota archaeon]|nr:hypothetical protein [Candidatus Woesearchaeota archaeon]
MYGNKRIVLCAILSFSILLSMSAVLGLTDDYSSADISESSGEERSRSEPIIPVSDYVEKPSTYMYEDPEGVTSSTDTLNSRTAGVVQPNRYRLGETPHPTRSVPRIPTTTFRYFYEKEPVFAPAWGRDRNLVLGGFEQQYPVGHGRYLNQMYDESWETSRAQEVWTKLFTVLGTPFTYQYAADSPYYSDRRQSAPYSLPGKRKVIYGLSESGHELSRLESDPKLRSIFKDVYEVPYDERPKQYLTDKYGPHWQVQRDREVFERLAEIYGDPFMDFRDVPIVHAGTLPQLRAFRSPNTIKAPLVHIKKDLKEAEFWQRVAALNLELLSQYDQNWGIMAFQPGQFIFDLVEPYEDTWHRRIISDNAIIDGELQRAMETAIKVQDPFDGQAVAAYYTDPYLREGLYQYLTTPGIDPENPALA